MANPSQPKNNSKSLLTTSESRRHYRQPVFLVLLTYEYLWLHVHLAGTARCTALQLSPETATRSNAQRMCERPINSSIIVSKIQLL